MKGCLAFRKHIIEINTQASKDEYKNKFINGIDPFICSITIAGLCHYIYRNILLKSDTIAIIPENGYYKNQNHSYKSIQWLEYLSYTNKIKIFHARNGGEQKIGDFLVDGYDKESNTVYQFHGCYWHGHEACYTSGTYNRV